MRFASILVITLGITGCASTTDSPEGLLEVSVSAANYSQVSGEELYRRINAPENTHPVPPTPTAPTRPLFYAFVPVDYSPVVPLETVYRELATPLAQRGYFNIVYQFKAGLAPNRIDYLLRIYCGRRFWRTPTVRADRFTWGNDGPVYSWLGLAGPGTANVIGLSASWDARVGTSPSELAGLAMNLQEMPGNVSQMAEGMGRGGGPIIQQQGVRLQEQSRDPAARFCYLLVIEAYKFEDVRDRKNDAPCAWATFVAVPMRQGLEMVSVLHTMARAAMPYLGTTTDGIQLFELPPGKVLVGAPVKAPGQQEGTQR